MKLARRAHHSPLSINPFRKAIGIDLSDLVVRAVQVQGHPDAFQIHALSERQIPEGIINGGDIQNPKKLAAILDDLLEKPWFGKFSGSYVTLSLPERKTFLKLITIPRAKGGDPTEVVRFEATNHIPMNLDEVYMDWEYIHDPLVGTRDTRRVLVGAAPRDLVESYLAVFRDIKYSPVACELESIALYRSLATAIREKGASLVIDFGGSETLFMLANNRTVLFTSTVPTGGDALTSAIQQKLGISHTEAEKAKILYGLESKRGKGKIRTILLPLLHPYQQKIDEILTFYADHFPQQEQISRLILAGAGSRLKGLSEHLYTILQVPVTFANPKSLLTPQRRDPFANTDATPYATAIGLALREHLHDYA